MVNKNIRLNFENYWQPVGVYYLIQFLIGFVLSMLSIKLVATQQFILMLMLALGISLFLAQIFEVSYWRLLVSIALSVLVISGAIFVFFLLFGLFALTI